MSDTPVTSVDVPLETGGAVDPADVVRSTQIVTVHHNPGDPLETAEDAAAREQLASEQDDHVDSLPTIPEYDGVDTTSVDGNYDTRSNIVRP